MAIELKTEAFILTMTLTTPLITAAPAEKIRVTHVIASCGSTGGTITLKKVDSDKAATVNLWNARTITAGGNLELFDTNLDGNDQLQGGFTGATQAHLSIDYQVFT